MDPSRRSCCALRSRGVHRSVDQEHAYTAELTPGGPWRLGMGCVRRTRPSQDWRPLEAHLLVPGPRGWVSVRRLKVTSDSLPPQPPPRHWSPGEGQAGTPAGNSHPRGGGGIEAGSPRAQVGGGGRWATVHSKERRSPNVHFEQVPRPDEHQEIEHTCRPLTAGDHSTFSEGPAKKTSHIVPSVGTPFPQQPSAFLFK